MADEPIDFMNFAGRLVFPKSPTDLTDTGKCPACFYILRGATICPSCRLDLNHPAAAELHDTSVRAADTILERARIIGRMRYETDRLLAERAAGPMVAPTTAAAATPPATTIPAPAPVEPAAPEGKVSIRESADAGSLLDQQTAAEANSLLDQQTGAGASPLLDQQRAAASVDRPKRSSVQVSLLVIGVSLLSIAAIFFLIYAFIVFGLVWRSVIVGAITVAAFVAASMLRGRNLSATAEGIAVFAVVLVYLDAWALKANDMFGLGSVDNLLYWGAVLVLSSVGFAFWHRRSLLRAPNVAAFAALAPGMGLLAAGLYTGDSGVRQAFIGFAAAGVAGVAHVATRHRRFERTVVLTMSLGAVIVAAGISLGLTAGAAESVNAGPAIVAAVALLVFGSLLRSKASSTFAILFGIVTGISTASAVSLGGLLITATAWVMLVPLVSAVVVTLVWEFLWRRSPEGPARRALAATTIGAAVVAGISAITPVGVVGFGTIYVARHGLTPSWPAELSDIVLDRAGDVIPWAILAIVAVAALELVSARLNKNLAVALPVAGWILALASVGAVPLLSRLDLVVAAWLVLAALSLVALRMLRDRTTFRGRYRAVLMALAAASAILGYTLSWAHRDLWWIATLAIIAMLLFSRMLAKTTGARAAFAGAAAALALLSAGSVANRLTLDVNPGLQVGIVNYVTLTCVVAAVLVLLSALPADRIASALDRRVVFWVGFAGAIVAFGARAIVTGGAPADALARFLLPEWITSLALALALLGGLAAWVFVPANKPSRVERIAASIAATPALYLLVTAFTRVLGLPAFLDAIAPVSAALLGAAASLTLTVTRPSSVPRWAREVGVAAVAVPAVVGALRTDTGLAWLALVLAGVTALLLAIDKQGLFTSTSPRRHYGWLALALGTAGLWWRLRGDQVTALEPYVLPLAAALIVIALLIARAAGSQPSPAAPAVALAGALVALVPLGINGATGALERPVIVAAASAVLLLLGSFAVTERAWQRWLDAAALAGAIGVTVTVVARALLTRDAVTVDAWAAALFVVLLAAAFGQARKRREASAVERWREIAGVALAIIAMTAVLLFELPQFGLRLGTVRALAVLLIFAAIHIVSFFVNARPLTPLVGWVAMAYAGIAGIVGVVGDVLDPLELATIPLAAALLTTGAHRLATVAEARSWPWLAPGLLVLLLPSLFATATLSPWWRLVGLGAVAIAVLVIGAVKRLQAPFVIGAVVVLWHGIATFQPQLRAVYEAVPWWLWLGIGGVLLIVLAARYEKRIANLKSVAMRFAALR
ncbi:MAG: hypothetical protein KF680_05650 [Cryobacterium sp.]|nr:hypothetical protein [Cryobacterium sp.]